MRYFNKHGYYLSKAGRHLEALYPLEESLSLSRILYARDPDQYRQGLSNALAVYAESLKELSRSLEACEVFSEAVEHTRELHAQDPESFVGLLADRLDELGKYLHSVDRLSDTFNAWNEALDLCRTMHPNDPIRYRDQIQPTLAWYAFNLDLLHRTSEASELRREIEELQVDNSKLSRASQGEADELDGEGASLMILD